MASRFFIGYLTYPYSFYNGQVEISLSGSKKSMCQIFWISLVYLLRTKYGTSYN